MPHSEAILERMLRLTDRFIETRERVHEIHLEVKELKTEFQVLKASKKGSENSMISGITTFLKEVMPSHWWALTIFLLLASLTGLISPKTIISQFMSQSSPEQRPEHS